MSQVLDDNLPWRVRFCSRKSTSLWQSARFMSWKLSLFRARLYSGWGQRPCALTFQRTMQVSLLPSSLYHSSWVLPLSVCNTSPKSWGEAKVALSRDSCCREPEAFSTEQSSGAGWAPRGNPISNCSRQFSGHDRESRFQLAIYFILIPSSTLSLKGFTRKSCLFVLECLLYAKALC